MGREIRKILIPTDYSLNATRATNFGFSLAKMTGAQVVLFHAYHFPLTTSEDMVYIDQMREGEEEKLLKEKEKWAAKFPNITITTEVEFGSVVDLITTITEREKIDLIVMGTKGESNVLDAVLGSVAANVINDVRCSTLVIPEEVRELNISEVVFASDFHPTKNYAYFGPLLHILDKTGASVSVLNVKPELDFEEVPSKSEIQTNSIFANYKLSHHFLESDNVEEAILDFAQVNEANLIVILTKHYSLWQRIWHTSLARKLALHSTKPLLVIHEDA